MRVRPCVLSACWLASCQAPPALPPGFAALAADAPESQPLRLQLADDRIVAAAVPLGPGGLPAAVRPLLLAIEPGGETVYEAREWSWRGDGYRVEKVYGEGREQQFRSALIAADGTVLERSHSVPIGEVPQAVLLVAMAGGRRELLRAEIVSDRDREVLWRLSLRDGGGRRFSTEVALDGSAAAVRRVLEAEVLTPMPAGR